MTQSSFSGENSHVSDLQQDVTFSLGWRRRRHLAGARRQRRQDLLLWLRRPAPPGCSTRGLLAVALLVARVPYTGSSGPDLCNSPHGGGS